MPDFSDLRRRLSDTRRAHDEARRALLRANDQLAQVDMQLRELDRWARRDDRRGGAERRALEEKKRRLEETCQERETVFGRVEGELADLQPVFWDQWTDPREHAGQMNDDIPMVLFPMRLETRFKTLVGRDGREQRQLWVRIYPDECLIDTFEETLSQVELDSAAIFWREYFRAAGVEAEERAAWRALVASHGSGRAAWIIKHYRPLNPLEPGDPRGDSALEVKPLAKAAGELILVASSEASLTNPERAALATYWAQVWKAEGRANLESTAIAALRNAVGIARASELVSQFRPYNLAEPLQSTFTRETTTVRLSLVFLPRREDVDVKTRSWMKAASAELLPERFVLLGFRGNDEILNQIGAPVQAPFAVSPDPIADPESQFQFDEHGNLSVGEDLLWMTDFDEAVRRGMGFRVDLTPRQAAGFDRLFALGLRLGSDAAQGKTELERLLQNHFFSRAGFSLLPQGAPTNNTEDGNSAYSREDDADESYDFVFKGEARFTETENWLDKTDGQWFAESLGLDTDWLQQVPNAGGVDQAESRAINTALWPATLGYFMDTLLLPVFDDDEIYYTRWFFSRFVSGRGMVPAIRIGRQPYGILPTCAFSRIRWIFDDENVSIHYSRRFQESRGRTFQDWLRKYKGVLDQLRGIWRNLALGVSHVGMNTADPQNTLLDVLGLHPASVEFHQRYANTKQQEHNIAAMWQLAVRWQTLPANELHNEAFSLLVQLGYPGPQTPQLFDLFWKVGVNRLNGPVIQEGPLSETEPLRAVTTNDRNYIEWLHEWAGVSFDTVRVQDGFRTNQAPNALLYVLLRHALELGYYDAGVRILDDALLLDGEAKRSLRSEPYFFQVRETSAAAASAATTAVDRSRYEMLYSPNERVTGDPRMPFVQFITSGTENLFGARYLTEQLRALKRLARTPTARLERIFAEHLDCCTYRLDAWMSGLVNFQLASMRYSRRVDDEGIESGPRRRKGIYLGAYGWLENVVPEGRTLTEVRLAGELDEVFNRHQPEGQRSPLLRDDQNEGYIHAPSVNHAVTAAVLRNGYLAHATPQQPELLKVNLSSERVRAALVVIEGIRNGQSLAALLGYQFERGLHDRYALAECDKFIYSLRREFPLYTSPEDMPDGVSIQSVEARNVVNGLNLVRFVRNAAPADKKYPFGFPVTRLPGATPGERAAIDAEVDRLLDIHDALADLALAEGVHQVVMGNYDRAAATLDAYGQATFPPIPDVVQTPRSGIALTHRVGLQFEVAVAALASDNPRVKAEPAINRWVAGRLPAAARIGCTVEYEDAATGAPRKTLVTLANLGLQPLDLLYVMNPDNLEARSELDDRIRDFVLRNGALGVRPDLLRGVSYGEGAAGDFSFVEVAPLVRSLRALLLRSRTLRATDVVLPTEARSENSGDAVLARARVDFLPTDLTNLKNGTRLALQNQLDAVLPAAGPVTATILANIDDYLNDAIAVCRDIALYGVPQTGLAAFHEGRAAIFRRVLNRATDIARRWQSKLDEYDALMLTLPTLMDEGERIDLLVRAEMMISTIATDLAGKTSTQMLASVQAKEALFRARRTAFESLPKSTETTIAGLLADFEALPPVTDFDSQPITADDEKRQIVILAEDIRTRVRQLGADLEKLVAAVQDKLTAHDGTSISEQRVQLLMEAAKSVFGGDFVLVPSFTVPERQALEWRNAYDGRESLLDHQKTVLDNEFPVDDWLYGLARVREKLHHLENLTFLSEAFGLAPPELRPLQLPFRADAPWMALDYPESSRHELERELLLYTAIYAEEFDEAKPQSGLLLDEWTEVIPALTETTGLAFHFDKPNAEPPQAILLATPTEFTGAWSWQDLVDMLHETLDLARLRAVEPQQLDQTPLSVFLPATILATTWSPVTIAADLAVVNRYASRVP